MRGAYGALIPDRVEFVRRGRPDQCWGPVALTDDGLRTLDIETGQNRGRSTVRASGDLSVPSGAESVLAGATLRIIW